MVTGAPSVNNYDSQTRIYFVKAGKIMSIRRGAKKGSPQRFEVDVRTFIRPGRLFYIKNGKLYSAKMNRSGGKTGRKAKRKRAAR